MPDGALDHRGTQADHTTEVGKTIPPGYASSLRRASADVVGGTRSGAEHTRARFHARTGHGDAESDILLFVFLRATGAASRASGQEGPRVLRRAQSVGSSRVCCRLPTTLRVRTSHNRIILTKRHDSNYERLQPRSLVHNGTTSGSSRWGQGRTPTWPRGRNLRADRSLSSRCCASASVRRATSTIDGSPGPCGLGITGRVKVRPGTIQHFRARTSHNGNSRKFA